MEYKWEGQVVEGEICSTYKSSKGTRYFIELTKTPEETYDRGGHEWPVEGCIVLVDEV
jgi:hypothetical protein